MEYIAYARPLLLALLVVALPAGVSHAQSRKGAGSVEPTVEEAVGFVASQVELDENVKEVRRVGRTGLRLTRLRTSPFRDGRTETIEFDLIDFDEHLISGTSAQLNCARKGCVRYLNEAGGEVLREENRLFLDASSSARATRIVQAASHVRDKAGKKTPF